MSTVARYVFNLITPSGGVNDFAKAYYPSLDDARAEALLVAQELMSRAANQGRDVSSYYIEICNEERRTLSVVTFKQACD
ncbi:hypothetical protein AMC82_PD00929 (plasmid) [Rhizobium phaseoli]|uniref:DUF6894 domain-containing protein n=1 Tax=Rhizobium phaseoli TaxID=396 RepID=A0A7X6J2M4_9HYPH|nr:MULTISPECIES: hypothetical protein [Rhizobium]ANL38275.1 hypothetical protein AMC89_PD00817 [Rhizobium phaseoli]ANL69891.1 hypothetical protein AMC84_PD00933 [Rhizobium phaseoli]ANL76327.1 hypothetical protein AMC83_PE00919 [Rhizobium phaseoli]ANL82683.1 hypothetical protein AMC82_PD00929 [Rhizobium phaseoli]ANM01979.1 hypothetical protein AMC79_PD00814 [Rhizobium phaseoli]